MRSNTKSNLFLLEMIISLLVFSLCALICVGIYAKSAAASSEAEALNKAVILCESTAEKVKAGVIECGTVINFDKDFNESETEIKYRLSVIENKNTDNAVYFDAAVTDIINNTEIYIVSSAAIKGGRQ